MPNDESIRVLGQWEGYHVSVGDRFEAGAKGPRAEVWIELIPDRARREAARHPLRRFVAPSPDPFARLLRDTV